MAWGLAMVARPDAPQPMSAVLARMAQSPDTPSVLRDALREARARDDAAARAQDHVERNGREAA